MTGRAALSAGRLLLDTHIALWLGNEDPRLKRATREVIDRCWQSGGLVLLSAVFAWETAQLLFSGRLTLDFPLETWISRFSDRPGVEHIPISHKAAAGAYALPDLEHRDPGDRLLIAQAIEHACPFVTYDERIIRFAETHGPRYGFSTIIG
jgi:PIN domain nuclease of toxin-antitoxin system